MTTLAENGRKKRKKFSFSILSFLAQPTLSSSLVTSPHHLPSLSLVNFRRLFLRHLAAIESADWLHSTHRHLTLGQRSNMTFSFCRIIVLLFSLPVRRLIPNPDVLSELVGVCVCARVNIRWYSTKFVDRIERTSLAWSSRLDWVCLEKGVWSFAVVCLDLTFSVLLLSLPSCLPFLYLHLYGRSAN